MSLFNSNGWACSNQIAWCVFNTNWWVSQLKLYEWSTPIDEFVKLKIHEFLHSNHMSALNSHRMTLTYHNINKYDINNNEIISNLMDHLNNTQKQIIQQSGLLLEREVVTWFITNHDLHNQPPLLFQMEDWSTLHILAFISSMHLLGFNIQY
jgi:hypothetical protein